MYVKGIYLVPLSNSGQWGLFWHHFVNYQEFGNVSKLGLGEKQSAILYTKNGFATANLVSLESA